MTFNTTLEEKTADAARDLQKAAESGVRSFTDSANALRDQAGTSAREIGDAAAQEAARVGELVRTWIGRQSDQARHAATAVRDEAQAMKHRTERYVTDEPMKSVLIAAAAGALVTALVMFASRRRVD